MRSHHKILFGLIMAVMLISPVAKVPVDYFDFSIMPLKGHIVYAEYPEFTWHSWFDGSYQKDYENYLEDHIGLRSFIVRIHNEMDFSLYRKCQNKGIIVGKEDYLYQIDYIDAYLGKTFIGHEAINAKCQRIKAVQEELDKLDIELLIVMAPGKASMFPEYIPERYLKDSTGISNNTAYLACFKEYGINHIDFNTLFREMKDTYHYPLYHKCGIHWNVYGAYYALDSIVNYMETAKGIDMADMSYEGIEMSFKPRATDYDIGNALNIFSRISDRAMPYPYGYKYITEGKDKPNLMVIADSYYWTIYNLHNSKLIWNEQDFRYYNLQLFSPGKPDKEFREITIHELQKFDFIMTVYTEQNMDVLANNFFEKAYATLFESIRLEEIKASIRNDEQWLTKIEAKAERKGISVEEMINRDALWLLVKELENQSSNTNNE